MPVDNSDWDDEDAGRKEAGDLEEKEIRDLRSEVARQDDEIELLRRGNEQLKVQLEALRGDFSARVAEQEEELRVQLEVCRQGQKEADKLQNALRESKSVTRFLKSQNLSLQHHLNAWGIPVSSGTGNEYERFEQSQKGMNRFFPPMVPPTAGVDPAPIALRGDLSIFHLASLLSFVENNTTVGVLTVVNEDVVTKLFAEGGALRLVAWNERSPTLGLTGLLVESDLLTREEASGYHEESLYDLEIAYRLVWEGKLDTDTVRACLREHCRVIMSELLYVNSGAFFFQLGRPSCEKDLLFTLPITDFLLRAAARVDEESRNVGDTELSEIDDLSGFDELSTVEELSGFDSEIESDGK